MRKVMRPRYYCEHCKKGGGSGGHIRRHEETCTANPNRQCRICSTLLGQKQPKLEDLMALLPNVEEQRRTQPGFDHGPDTYYFDEIPEETVKRLREAAGHCPACMMAAIRQRGLPVTTAESFKFKDELREIWNEINAANMEKEYAYY